MIKHNLKNQWRQQLGTEGVVFIRYRPLQLKTKKALQKQKTLTSSVIWLASRPPITAKQGGSYITTPP
jgi:hypothetical protein